MKYTVALLLSSAAALRFEDNNLIQDNEQIKQEAPIAEPAQEVSEEPAQAETQELAQAET